MNYLKKGQSLVEVVFALAIVMIIAVGLVSGATASIVYARNSKTRSQAVKYAQQGLELARQKRDEGWGAFVTTYANKDYCINTTNDLVVKNDDADCPTIGGQFQSLVKFSAVDSVTTALTVTSTTSWTENNRTKSVTLTTQLTNWK